MSKSKFIYRVVNTVVEANHDTAGTLFFSKSDAKKHLDYLNAAHFNKAGIRPYQIKTELLHYGPVGDVLGIGA